MTLLDVIKNGDEPTSANPLLNQLQWQMIDRRKRLWNKLMRRFYSQNKVLKDLQWILHRRNTDE